MLVPYYFEGIENNGRAAIKLLLAVELHPTTYTLMTGTSGIESTKKGNYLTYRNYRYRFLDLESAEVAFSCLTSNNPIHPKSVNSCTCA